MVKGPFRKLLVGRGGGGGGGLYSGGLYMEEYLRFENAIFCSCKCNFLKFSAHNMSLLLIFFSLFYFNNVLTTVNTTLYS